VKFSRLSTMYTLIRDDDHEGEDIGKWPKRRVTRRYYYVALITVLVWGCYLLMASIQQFRHPSDADIERFLRQKQSLMNHDYDGKLPLTISAQRSGLFSPTYKTVQWIKTPDSIANDKGTYVVDDDGNYIIKSIVDDSYNYSLYNGTGFTYNNVEYEIDNLKTSPDLLSAIIKTNSTHNWRHSTFALYWVLDVESGKIEPLYDNNKLAVAAWSPDSNKIAFIYENNIYLKNLKDNQITQITFDGSQQIFNGKPDWVYEEEIFGQDIVLWWSPNSKQIAFLKSNDTLVPEYYLEKFVQKTTQDYPTIETIKYPKAGYPNPVVNVAIYELDANKASIIELDGEIDKIERLITEVVWIGNKVLVKSSNRASDLLEIFLIEGTNAKLVRTEHTSNGWFEITENTVYVPKDESLSRFDDGYIDTIVDGGYNHLAYFSPPDSKNGILLTHGDWEVVGGVLSFNQRTNDVYFVSTMKSSIERHIHSVNLIDKNIEDITVHQGYYAGSFSAASRYLLLIYQGPKVPYQELIDLQEDVVVKKIETNQEVSKNLQKYVLPEIKYEVVELVDEETGEKFKANSKETLPLNFNSKRKYPVVFFVYGGPNSQTVNKRFAVDFSAVLAAELDCVVVTVDGRGTGFNNHNPQGSHYKFVVRDQLGKYEPLDQIAAAKHWAKKEYVDTSRIAIWGWSYGGFLTLKTLETDYKDSIFSYGVSIAPVTQWRLYDSVYTERYMRTPQENPEGYKVASIHNITNFSHVKKFFIGHGSGDDNVHIQNSLKLLDQFNLQGIENYDFMIFPDSDHSISFHGAYNIVYDRILDFFRQSFNQFQM